MDLRIYYEKIRELETKIPDEFPVVVSRETGDGGKDGTLTEVPRRLAAKMVVEGLARIASRAEADTFRQTIIEAKRAADQLAEVSKVQLTVLPTAELTKLKGSRSKE